MRKGGLDSNNLSSGSDKKKPAAPSSIPSHTRTHIIPQQKWERSRPSTAPTLDARETPHVPKATHIYIYINSVAYLFMTNTGTQSPSPLPQVLPLRKCTDWKAGRICFEISNERVFPPFFHSQALSVAIRLKQGCQQTQEAPSRVQAFKPAKPEGMDLRTHSRSWLNLFYFDGGSWGRNIISEMPKQ